jgi:integrase/recombinase XerD
MGEALSLSHAEIQLLFSQGLQTPRDSEALLLTADRTLLGICLFTAYRIQEACTLILLLLITSRGLLFFSQPVSNCLL